MSSSTEITGGEGVISLRLPFVGGAIASGADPEARTRHRAACLGWGEGARGAGRVACGRHLELWPSHYEELIRRSQECSGRNTSAAGWRTARCGDAAVQSVGHTRSTGVSARDPDTGLSRPPGQRRGPTPPNRKGEADANLSRGSAGGGRAVHPHRGRTSRAGTRRSGGADRRSRHLPHRHRGPARAHAVPVAGRPGPRGQRNRGIGRCRRDDGCRRRSGRDQLQQLRRMPPVREGPTGVLSRLSRVQLQRWARRWILRASLCRNEIGGELLRPVVVGDARAGS